MIAPHGGKLVNLLIENESREEILEKIPELPHLILADRNLSDLQYSCSWCIRRNIWSVGGIRNDVSQCETCPHIFTCTHFGKVFYTCIDRA